VVPITAPTKVGSTMMMCDYIAREENRTPLMTRTDGGLHVRKNRSRTPVSGLPLMGQGLLNLYGLNLPSDIEALGRKG